MSDTEVPNSDHVLRYCSKTKHKNGRISGAAFILRPQDDGLSVNWLEFLNKDNRNDELNEIRKVYKEKRFIIKPSAKFAVLNVGEVRKYVTEESLDNRDLKVFHKRSEKDHSHSEICNINLDDDLISDLIAQKVKEIHNAI